MLSSPHRDNRVSAGAACVRGSIPRDLQKKTLLRGPCARRARLRDCVPRSGTFISLVPPFVFATNHAPLPAVPAFKPHRRRQDAHQRALGTDATSSQLPQRLPTPPAHQPGDHFWPAATTRVRACMHEIRHGPGHLSVLRPGKSKPTKLLVPPQSTKPSLLYVSD